MCSVYSCGVCRAVGVVFFFTKFTLHHCARPAGLSMMYARQLWHVVLGHVEPCCAVLCQLQPTASSRHHSMQHACTLSRMLTSWCAAADCAAASRVGTVVGEGSGVQPAFRLCLSKVGQCIDMPALCLSKVGQCIDSCIAWLCGTVYCAWWLVGWGVWARGGGGCQTWIVVGDLPQASRQVSVGIDV